MNKTFIKPKHKSSKVFLWFFSNNYLTYTQGIYINNPFLKAHDDKYQHDVSMPLLTFLLADYLCLGYICVLHKIFMDLSVAESSVIFLLWYLRSLLDIDFKTRII